MNISIVEKPQCDKFLSLRGGGKMPLIGLGTWMANNEEEFERALDAALTAGYRHFDTAYNYKNEHVIGRVLKRWLDSEKVKREELFIVTKLPMIGNTPDKVPHFLSKQLQALQLSYVDLYLIHAPVGFKYIDDNQTFPMGPDGAFMVDTTTNLEELWKAMEQQVDQGHVKAIGISNFNEKQTQRIVNIARVPVSNMQMECHVYFQQKSIRQLCAKNNITVCAYAPFSSPGRAELYKARGVKFEIKSPLEDPIVLDIAKKHRKAPGQVLLRFLIQLGIAVIPKSTNPKRLEENFSVFDFELSKVDMGRLESLDRGDSGRTFNLTAYRGAEKHPECPF